MKIKSINPRTGKLIKSFDEISKNDIQITLDKAKLAQVKWASYSKQERIAIIRRLKIILKREETCIANIVYEEVGFSKADTLSEISGDILIGIDTHIEDYKEIKTADYSSETCQAEVQFIPQGVVGHIGIWNYPVWQTLITAVPALLAGNAIIYKLSEYATMTGLKIAEIIWEAGVPKDVFIPIIGGPKVGEALVKSNVDMIVFTGGTKTGNSIIKNAQTKPLLLELSGNDAGIVCDDCDLDQTIRGMVYGGFLHSGQVCTRIKRIFVMRNISDKFIEGYLKKAEKLKIGEEISPLIRNEAREKIDYQVKAAIKNGAKPLLGGHIILSPGFYYEPTVLLCDKQKDMYKDEIFGPVTLIQIVENLEEAINLANSTDYGLGASVWTKNPKVAMEVAEQLEVGMVWINDSNLAIPGGIYYGGIKQSGIATAQSRIMSFMKKKMIIANSKAIVRDWWY